MSWDGGLELCNIGKSNSRLSNTGYYNTGDWNTGYGNTANYSNDVFCTTEPTVNFFNKLSNMTLSQFYNSRFYDILNKHLFLAKWISELDMTDEEKKQHPEYNTLGGYLKTYS